MKTEITLVRQKTDFFRKVLNIPKDLYARMLSEAGLTYGHVTPFILEAIKEKLDREGVNRAANKELTHVRH